MSAVAAPAAVVPVPRASLDAAPWAVSEVGETAFAPVRGRAQDVVRTGSRRAEPRAWLRSIVWLVGAGLHPKAGASTVVVARDLAGRMDYRRGIVLYDLDGTVARTGLSRATVKRHVAVLRELGALVWLVHGSKQNLRMPGRAYTATATIYGAVIPPVFDEAMGHRLAGEGYEGRVCGVTEAGRERATTESTARSAARKQVGRGRRCTDHRRPAAPGGTGVQEMPPVDNSPVDNGRSECREPHSLGRSFWAGKVDVDGGGNYTSRERARRLTAPNLPSSTRNGSSSGMSRRPVRQVARDILIARQVRPLVPWTQTEKLRRLAYALRPLINEGLESHDIIAELHSWYLTWRPARPAAYITGQLTKRAARQTEAALEVVPAVPAQDNAEWMAYQRRRQAAEAILTEVQSAVGRTDEQRRLARYEGLHYPQVVVDACDDDLDDATDLYGPRLVARFYGRLGGSRNVRLAAI